MGRGVEQGSQTMDREPTTAPERGSARRLASPLHQVGPTTKPNVVIHSDDDDSVAVQQALDMTQALDDAGVC